MKVPGNKPHRITIAFSNKRKPLEAVLRKEQEVHPKANVKLCGGPGSWQVRRDTVYTDDLSIHAALDMRRGI